jgi:hypothetical protein
MSKQSIKTKGRPQENSESEVKDPPETFYGKEDLFMEGVVGFITEVL